MTVFSSTLLSAILSYGYPILGLCMLMGGMGIPLPTTFLVIASGAFIRQGILSPEAAGIGLVCVVLGDSLSFTLGRLGQGWLSGRFGETRAWLKASQTFDQRGGTAIYLTRWLLTSIAIPINLVAGGSGYHFGRFLLFDLVGEVTWFSVYGGLGYWFGSQWEEAQEVLAKLNGPVVVLALAGIFLFWGMSKMWRRVQAQRMAVER